MSEPRIDPVRDPDDEQRRLLETTLLHEGRPADIFATLAHHPRLLKRFNVLGGLFLTRGLLPARARELVILRVAWRTGAVYEWGQHVLLARAAGLDDDEIDRVAGDGTAGWPAADAVLLEFTDELLAQVDVSDGTWEAAAGTLDDPQLLELVCLIGFYRLVAGLLRTIRVQPESHLPGWPTDPPGQAG